MRSFLIILTFVLSGLCSAKDFDIVKAGKSDYVIVTPPDASAPEQFAAQALADYISSMTKAQLKVQNGGRIPARAIVVGEAKKLRQMAPDDLRFEIAEEECAIVPVRERLYLTGGRGRAVMYAAYSFLGRSGCKFLAPTFEHYRGTAEIVPTKNDLTFRQPKRTSNKPALAFRKLYIEEGHSHTIDNLKQMAEWMPKLGYNCIVVPTDYQGAGRVKWDNWREELAPELKKRDIIIEVGGHGYQNFINADMEEGKLFEQHPEWFGLDDKGERRREKGWVFCTSTPAAVEYMLKNFLQYVQARPEIEIFDFWPPDGAKWCHCPQCTAFGTPSDRQAILVNHVSEKVKQVRPDLRLECLAYHTSITPPTKAQLGEEVLLDFCPISQDFEVQINNSAAKQNAAYVEGLKAWRGSFEGDISVYSYYRKYAWDSLPVIIPHYMQKDLQYFKTVPVQGISSYAEPDDWFTYELNHYVLANLAWDQDANVDALTKDFAQARYGKAADTVVEAYRALENNVRVYCSLPAQDRETTGELQKTTNELASARDKLADVAAKENDEGKKHNLQRLDLMFQYALTDLEILAAVQNGEPEKQIRERGARLHAFLTQHANDGVYLVKNHRLSLLRLLGHYGIKEKRPRANRVDRSTTATTHTTTAPLSINSTI